MIQALDLILHNSRGGSLPDANFIKHLKEWDKTHLSEPIFGPIIKCTWRAVEKVFERLNPRNDHFRMLPNGSGFLICENLPRSVNLVLLVVYGAKHTRLSIPWQLTRTPT